MTALKVPLFSNLRKRHIEPAAWSAAEQRAVHRTDNPVPEDHDVMVYLTPDDLVMAGKDHEDTTTIDGVTASIFMIPSAIDEKNEVRKLGVTLFDQGGQAAMREVFDDLRRTRGSAFCVGVQFAWKDVGDWT